MNRFWLDRKVLITGHTGFKGAWLSIILQSLGAKICGISLPEEDSRGIFARSKIAEKILHFNCNINEREKVINVVRDFEPELIFHLAAQPLVRKSYGNPHETFNTNVIGSLNVLDAALASSKIKNFIFITTDKVYKNQEKNIAYKEEDELGGHDPYSSSKACSEILAESYRKSFFEKRNIPICTVRAGNVIGGGDWSKDRLIPDIIESIQTGNELLIRAPKSVRPWQHVLEPIFGYISIAEKGFGNMKFNQSINFGPEPEDIVNVETIIKKISSIDNNLHYKIENNSDLHEAGLLRLDINKVKSILEWSPKLNINEALKLTLDWYEAEKEGKDMYEFTLEQINHYKQL